MEGIGKKSGGPNLWLRDFLSGAGKTYFLISKVRLLEELLLPATFWREELGVEEELLGLEEAIVEVVDMMGIARVCLLFECGPDITNK